MNIKPDEVVILILATATLLMALALRPRLRGFPLEAKIFTALIPLFKVWHGFSNVMKCGRVALAFDRFHQASPATEGIGLGLNISRMILERFGGGIELHSEGRMKGTAVTVSLPLAR